MVAWGGLIIDVTVLIPYIPKLLTVVVPPMYSLGSNLPSLALLAMSFVLRAISNSPKVSALKTMGVISPP